MARTLPLLRGNVPTTRLAVKVQDAFCTYLAAIAIGAVKPAEFTTYQGNCQVIGYVSE